MVSAHRFPFAPWTHDRSNNSVDPLNLIFDKGISLSDVNKAFTDANKGWRSIDPVPGSPQWLHINNRRKKRDQDWYRVQVGLFRLYRYHVRLWNLPDIGVVGSAHLEVYPIHYKSEYFEGAEKEVALNLSGIDGLTVEFDRVFLDNFLRVPNNNGYATFFSLLARN